MIQLRDYQETLIDAARQKMLQGHSRVILCSPTGSGKRIIACWMAARRAGLGRRTAVVTDRRTLVYQMAQECQERQIRHGIIMADTPRTDDAPLQICAIQSLVARKWQDLPDADMWIIDEAHKTTRQYKKLLEYYPDAHVLSLTATPVGAQGGSLRDTLGPVVEPITNSELIDQGWLLPTKVLAPSEPDVKGVAISSSTGEYSQNKLGERVEECTVFADVFEYWAPYQHEQTMAFVPRVKYAYGLSEQFNLRGHRAAVIEANTKQADRDRIIRQFEDRKLRVLLNVATLVEGFDCPVANVGIDLTPCKQLRTYWQKIGRIKRPAGEQEHAVWLDFAGNWHQHYHPDDDPIWPEEEEETTAEIYRKKQEKDKKEPWRCKKCGYTLASWQRLQDCTCPECGTKTGKPTRRIRMGDGTMKEVKFERRKTKRSPEQKEWHKFCYVCLRKNWPIKRAAGMFREKFGDWPSKNLHPKPPRSSADWQKTPQQLYPKMIND